VLVCVLVCVCEYVCLDALEVFAGVNVRMCACALCADLNAQQRVLKSRKEGDSSPAVLHTMR